MPSKKKAEEKLTRQFPPPTIGSASAVSHLSTMISYDKSEADPDGNLSIDYIADGVFADCDEGAVLNII